MIQISKTDVVGWESAIRGMRNPLNSWDKSDSIYGTLYKLYDGTEIMTADSFSIGDDDLDLMRRLAKGGSDHAKYRRMITVYVDILAPLYWWKEFDTYKVGTVANSCSTMHKIHAEEFDIDDFSTDHLNNSSLEVMEIVITELNQYRDMYNRMVKLNKDLAKNYWWQMIQLLPSSYNQLRTVQLNYEVLANIYKARKNHKLDEWRQMCNWIESLPYSELITGGVCNE